MEYDPLRELLITDDYEEVKQALNKLNTPILDESTDLNHSQKSTSYHSIHRNVFSNLLKQKFIDKDEYYGVVLDVVQTSDPVSQRTITKIYVDIPGFDIEEVSHPDTFSSSEVNLDVMEHKAFFPVSDKLLEQEYPAFGDIARVKIPKNYFLSSTTNPYDKKYLGIFLKRNGVLPESPEKPTNPKAAAILNMTKEEKRDALFQNKPKIPIEERDKLMMPFTLVEGMRVSSLPNPRIRPTTGEPQGHYALDIGMVEGTEIYAATDHEIIPTKYDVGGFGNYIKGRSDKYLFYYGHLKEKKVTSGFVKKGTLIGLSGNTGGSKGPHLHFEMKDLAGKKINPMYFLVGTLPLKPSLKEEFGLKEDSITMPLPLTANQNTFDQISVDTSETATGLSAPPAESNPQQSRATPKSRPVNRPKMLLVDFDVDKSTGVRSNTSLGANSIKIREDLVPDLKKIKQILNKYNIPLTCESYNVSLTNNFISHLAKVGLEIKLNFNSALTPNSDLEIDDYFIGPDYSFPIGNGYKLIVYGNIKRMVPAAPEDYVESKKIIDVYDARNLNPNGAPKIKKIFKNVLNITKLFERNNFLTVLPKQDLFLYSDLKSSNWNIFQKQPKIVKGYTYKELLETVYYNNNEPIWKQQDLIWDGNKFI